MKIKAAIGAIFGLILVIAIAFSTLWIMKRFGLNDRTKPIIENGEAPDNAKLIDIHLPFGNPSGANSTDADNYFLANNYYTLSYNNDKGIPNWVAWRLIASDIGKLERQNDFRPDERLPKNLFKIRPSDYVGSGMGKGHMCPSGDRTSNIEANSSTFLMTNMIPQSHELNAGPWEKLESFSRSLAFRKKTLFIISGAYGEMRRYKRKLSVPANFWKVIAVMPYNSSPQDINAETQVIAVDMPNIDGIEADRWDKYKVSVRDIEAKTGYDFFSNLPKDLQDKIETSIDYR